MSRRREPRLAARAFALQFLWMGIILAIFFAFITLGGAQLLGEWFAQLYSPGQ